MYCSANKKANYDDPFLAMCKFFLTQRETLRIIGKNSLTKMHVILYTRARVLKETMKRTKRNPYGKHQSIVKGRIYLR